jgi:hypothetical protein
MPMIYDLNPYNLNMWMPNKDGSTKKVPRMIQIMFTKTLLSLYGILLLATVIFFINSYCNWF